MKTTIHYYRFDISDPKQADACNALHAELRATPGRGSFMNALCHEYNDGAGSEEVTLETKHLFDNQWNTPERRVFDWYEAIFPNRSIKQGHYLDITPEMREIRRNTNKCGFCGAQEPAQKGYVFCPHCIDSEYLKEEDLHLTRMVPVDEQRKARAPLSEAERAHLMPLYVKAQTEGATTRGKARLKKQRADLLRKRNTAIENANTEYNGLIWLMDHGISINNVIYYSHTGRFGFGWRKPIGDAEYSRLVDLLCEFPFDYDIKRA